MQEDGTVLTHGRLEHPFGIPRDGRPQDLRGVDVLVGHPLADAPADGLVVDRLEDGGSEPAHGRRLFDQPRDALDRLVGVTRLGVGDQGVGERVRRETIHLAWEPPPDVSEPTLGLHRPPEVGEPLGDEPPQRRQFVARTAANDPAPVLEVREHSSDGRCGRSRFRAQVVPVAGALDERIEHPRPVRRAGEEFDLFERRTRATRTHDWTMSVSYLLDNRRARGRRRATHRLIYEAQAT